MQNKSALFNKLWRKPVDPPPNTKPTLGLTSTEKILKFS